MADNEDSCVAALSRALEATDEDLFDAVHDRLLRLIASFVPFCTSQPGDLVRSKDSAAVQSVSTRAAA